jgi:hypothetical protein
MLQYLWWNKINHQVSKVGNKRKVIIEQIDVVQSNGQTT